MTDGRLDSRRYRAMRKAFRDECEAVAASCWLCNQPIDYSIPWKDPLTGQINDDAFELDHLYSRSKNPELTLDKANFRPSHRSCNRAKSNKMPSGGLGSLKRKWFYS